MAAHLVEVVVGVIGMFTLFIAVLGYGAWSTRHIELTGKH